jgi:hypothetical protein
VDGTRLEYLEELWQLSQGWIRSHCAESTKIYSTMVILIRLAAAPLCWERAESQGVLQGAPGREVDKLLPPVAVLIVNSRPSKQRLEELRDGRLCKRRVYYGPKSDLRKSE